MGLDVRMPMGLMFSVLGALLLVYGGLTLGRPGTAPTGVPINLVWGLFILLFGLVLIFLARRAR